MATSTAEIIVIPADANQPIRKETVEPKLKPLQEILGGYIEQVPVGDGVVLLANEDGLPLDLPVNERASALVQSHLVGNIVLCGIADGSDGQQWVSVPDGLWERVTASA